MPNGSGIDLQRDAFGELLAFCDTCTAESALLHSKTEPFPVCSMVAPLRIWTATQASQNFHRTGSVLIVLVLGYKRDGVPLVRAGVSFDGLRLSSVSLGCIMNGFMLEL